MQKGDRVIILGIIKYVATQTTDAPYGRCMLHPKGGKKYLMDNIEKITNIDAIETVFTYIVFLKEIEEFPKLNEYVPNSHIRVTFEAILNFLFFMDINADKLTRGKDYIKKIEHETDIYQPLTGDGLDNCKKIHGAYQMQREKHSQLRQAVKCMSVIEDKLWYGK